MVGVSGALLIIVGVILVFGEEYADFLTADVISLYVFARPLE